MALRGKTGRKWRSQKVAADTIGLGSQLGWGQVNTEQVRPVYCLKKKKSKNEPPTTKMSHFNSILLTETGT